MVMDGRRAEDFSKNLLLQFPVNSSCTPADIGPFRDRRLRRLLLFNACLQRQTAPQFIVNGETVFRECGRVRSSRSLVMTGEEVDWDDVTIILENHFRCYAGRLFLAVAEDSLRLPSFLGLRIIYDCLLSRLLILGGFVIRILGLAPRTRLVTFGTFGKSDIQDPNVSVK